MGKTIIASMEKGANTTKAYLLGSLAVPTISIALVSPTLVELMEVTTHCPGATGAMVLSLTLKINNNSQPWT